MSPRFKTISLLVLGVVVLSGAGAFAWSQSAPKPVAQDSCMTEPDPRRCFIDKAHHMAMQGDLKETLKYAEDVIAPYNRNVVHFSMHMIGMAAYERLQDRVKALALLPPEAFTNEGYLTYEGYQHGVLMEYFKSGMKTHSVDELVKESCADSWIEDNIKTKDFTWRKNRQCFHAAGHALMHAFENTIEPALAVCARLPHEWMQERCGYGVFMEASYLYREEYEPGAPRDFMEGENLAPICERQTQFQQQCAMFAGRSYLMRNKHQYEGAFGVCTELTQKVHADTCRQQIAEIHITDAGTDITLMKERCAAAGEFESACLLDVAQAVKDGYAGEAARALDVCRELPSELYDQCAKKN